MSASTTGNYPCQPVGASTFVNSVDLFVLMDAKPDVNKDVSSAKMSESFATVKILI